jgi:hypothetical protein
MAIISNNASAHPQTSRTIVQERILTGRITDLVITTVPEFGARASFRIECPAQCSVFSCIADDVAREFIAHYREGDMVAVRGFDEPRPSTAAANTPWGGRFRVREARVAEYARLAA